MTDELSWCASCEFETVHYAKGCLAPLHVHRFEQAEQKRSRFIKRCYRCREACTSGLWEQIGTLMRLTCSDCARQELVDAFSQELVPSQASE